MNCYLLGTLLDEHFEHALDAETEAALLAHLTTCAVCAAPYERERRLPTILAGSAGARACAWVRREGSR